MRTAFLTSCLALTFLSIAAKPATAQDMTGTSTLTVTLDIGSGDATFELEQDGEQLTGTYSGVLGELPVTGTVKGNAVELSFDSEAGKITYKGTVEDGVFNGTRVYGLLGEGTFSGNREQSRH